MRNSNRPSGPGKPTNERRDAVVEREEIDETLDDGQAGAGADADRSSGARQAERDAHVKGQDATATSGTSRNQRR